MTFWHFSYSARPYPLVLSFCLPFAPNSAILRDSHVLLLDEISAALDSVSEAALHSALRRVLKVREDEVIKSVFVNVLRPRLSLISLAR
jgi:ABC-type protease/lipase transport system fused ATPase/permease subunit